MNVKKQPPVKTKLSFIKILWGSCIVLPPLLKEYINKLIRLTGAQWSRLSIKMSILLMISSPVAHLPHVMIDLMMILPFID